MSETVPNARAPDDEEGPIATVRGKPHRLTPELTRLIGGLVQAGASIKVACQACGVAWSTASDWLRKGKAGVEPYDAFVESMQTAKAQHTAAMEAVVTSAAKRGQWQAAAWRLDRRSRAQKERDALGLGTTDERTVLVYPVPVPEGARIDELGLPPGHVIDTHGEPVGQPKTTTVEFPTTEDDDD